MCVFFLCPKQRCLVFFFTLLQYLCCVVSWLVLHYIGDANQLISLFDDVEGKLEADINLTGDLDFTSSGLQYPLGRKSLSNCVTYKGTLHGNGRIVKSLILSLKRSWEYNGDAGLFCSLSDATIENLVIDSSCSFNGTTTGALSSTALGSLTLVNVTNRASITGSNYVGGLIGQYTSANGQTNPLVSFDGCVNEGSVTGASNGVGGFIGEIGTSVTISCSNSINKGTVSSQGAGVGGFVEYISSGIGTDIVFSNCTNDGYILVMASTLEGLSGACLATQTHQ